MVEERAVESVPWGRRGRITAIVPTATPPVSDNDVRENSEPDSLDGVIAERLPILDELLAERGVALEARPLKAACDFVDLWVLKVPDASGKEFEVSTTTEVVTEKWFGALYQTIERWYRRRYHDAFNSRESRTLTGFVSIWSTPFKLAIPRVVREPDVPGETAWLRFPSAVLESERPLDWLCQPPSLDDLSRTQRDQLESEEREVATRLRSIEVSIMGIPVSDEALDGLLVAVSSHLRAAAEKAIIGGHPALETGGWDFHFAVECALKALLHVKSGSFPRIHVLADLYELAKPYLPDLPNELLERLPTAEEAIGYRYGGGRRLTLGCYWGMYQAALEIVETAMDTLAVLRLGQGNLNIARPPWTKPIS